MDKQTFMTIASRLYDEMSNKVTLFDNMVSEDECAEQEKKIILPYKMRKSSPHVALWNLAKHYNKDLIVFDKCCQDVGAVIFPVGKSRCISREDAELVIAVIARKYNNFND